MEEVSRMGDASILIRVDLAYDSCDYDLNERQTAAKIPLVHLGSAHGVLSERWTS